MMENKNKELGKLLANLLYENGINYCPFILNSEQANALDKRYKELHKKYGNGKYNRTNKKFSYNTKSSKYSINGKTIRT